MDPRTLSRLAIAALVALAGCASDSTSTAAKPAAAGPTTPATSTRTQPQSAPANRTAALPPPPAGSGAMAVIGGTLAPAPNIAMGDPATIARIIQEGKEHNRVMDHLAYLTEQIGPRLTGSAGAERANTWTADQFRAFGCQNVELAKWGEVLVRFDRGPSTGRVVATRRTGVGDDAKAETISLRDLEFTTPAWTLGTEGPVRGPVVAMPTNEEEYSAAKDRLKGAWVLVRREPPPQAGGERQRFRRRSSRMEQRADAQKKIDEGATVDSLPIDQRILFEGVAGFVVPSRDDLVHTGGVDREWDTRPLDQYSRDIEVTIRAIDYDYINSRLADGRDVDLEFNLDQKLAQGPFPVYNTVAEIPGTMWPEQVVIVSGHLDSWNGPGSQGALDNGTGSAVTLEAARLLMAAHAKPKRTIRFILWTGEEQGLLGSRAYVKQLKEKGQLDNVSAVLVDDGGTNYEGGLICTEPMVPMLAAATAPVNAAFPDMTVNIHTKPYLLGNIVSGSDHASFVAEGIPGFFWDEVGRSDYNYAHHTQHDRLDLAIPEYLVQSSTCAAITAYNLACADSMLPRDNVRPPKKEDSESQPGSGRTPAGSAGGGAGR
ncbi:MAG: M20/M25/M40 family metallo-hydrolase [Phycisphaerales bacterium]|nr:M20/M25/M40 family metallo-hydrolase [Phycisphaerales bacterium]